MGINATAALKLSFLKLSSSAAIAAATGGMSRTAAGRGTTAATGMAAGSILWNYNMGDSLIDQIIRICRKTEAAVCPVGF